MRISTSMLALIFALPLSVSSHADGPAKGVVELFTSQGCSSCPPADAALSGLIDRGGYVTLAWHVDYWDYLGWKDTFSSPAATSRQARYGSRIGGGSYTPEFVMNGSRGDSSGSVVGGSGLPISVSIANGQAKIGAGTGSADVFLVSYSNSATVPIKRGENAGRDIIYRHIVTGMRNLGAWNGEAMTVDAGGGNCAVILQRQGQGEIIGAAQC